MSTSTRQNRKSSHFSPYFIKRLSSWLVLSTALTLAASHEVRAAAVAWEGDTGGTPGDAVSWTDANNWTATPSGITPGDDLTFGLGTVGTINLGGNQIANSLTFNASFSLGPLLTTDQLTITSGNVTATAAATINAIIAGTSGLTLTAGSTNTLTLTADNSLTLTGGISILGGTLSVSADNNLGAAGNGVTLAGGALQSTTTFASARVLTLGAGGGTVVVTGTNILTLSTGMATTADSLTKSGTGTLTLGAASGRTGLTALNNGKISLTDLGGLGTGAVTVASGARLESLAAVAGNLSAPVILNGGTLSTANANQMTLTGAATLTVNAPSFVDTSSGKIFLGAANLLSGSGSLTKTGSGIFQLSAANASYTGNMAVNGGFLESASGGLGSGVITVNGGGELVAANGTLTNALTINGGAISGDNGTSAFTGAIAASGNFNVNLKDFYQATGRSLNLNGAISGTGNMNVVSAVNAQSLALRGNNSGYSGTITINPLATVVGMTGATNDALGSGSITLSGGTLSLSPALTSAGVNSGFQGRYYNAGAALIGNGVVGGYDFGLVTPVGVRNDADINIPNNGTTLILPSPVAGFNAANVTALWTGVLNITAGGTYTFFTGSDDGSLLYVDGQQVVQNDFSQAFNERSGVVTLSAGFHTVIAKFGQGGGGAGMTVNYQGADSGNLKVLLGSGVPGKVTNTGSPIFGATTVDNNITLTANSSIDLAGTTATNTGTLTFGSGNALTVTGVTGSESFTQGAAVSLSGSNTITTGVTQVLNGVANSSTGADVVISGNIGEAVGGSSLTKAGPRTLTLTGNNNFTGGITISAGTLVANVSGLALGNVLNNAALVLDQTGGGTFNGNITGSGTIVKQNTGTVTLGGTNTVNAAFTINNGAIILASNLAGTGTVAVNNGGSLSGPGVSVANPVIINAHGTIVGTTNSSFNTTNLTLNAARASFSLGAPGLTPAVTSSGTFTPNLTLLSLGNGGGAAAGTYRLFDFGTALTPAQFNNFVLLTNPAGFFGSLVNNTGNSSLDLVLAAAAATKTWDGAINGVWDTGTPNWTGGTFTNGEQAIFPAGVANRTITGPTVSPQSVTVDTSTGNYSIANNLAGGVVGGVTKTSAGTLTLTGNNNITGKTTVSAGTLSASINNAAGTRSAGTGVVELGGGTYSITPTASAVLGVTGSYFTGTAAVTSARDVTGTPVLTRIEATLNNTYTSTVIPGAGVGTVNGGNLENWGALFTGKYFVSTAGLQSFTVASDDSTRLFIDGVPVIINEGGQGGAFGLTNTISLSAGYHDLKLQYNQGSGGAVVRLFTPNGNSMNGLTLADPINLGSDLNVTASSTVDLVGGNYATASFGALTQVTGSTLTINGLAGKQLSFGSTLISGTGTVTINSAPDVTLGVLSASGVSFVKQGVGRLVLDNTSATNPNVLTGASVEVQGGKLVVVGGGGANSPLGTASVTLNGGGLFLDAKSAASSFLNNVTLLQSATIESLPSTLTMTLGASTNTLALGSNALTIDTYGGGTGSFIGMAALSIGNAAGSTLQISSTLTGSGSLTKTSTLLNTANTVMTNRNPGSLVIAGESPSFSGAVNLNAGALTATATLASASPKPLGTGALTINSTHVLSGTMPTTLLGTNYNTAFVNGNSSSNALLAGVSLSLKANGAGSNSTITYGNALVLTGTGTEVAFDVNNASANSNNEIRLGSLTISGSVNRIDVTGANSYFLGFDPTVATALPAGGFTVAASTGNVRFGQNLSTAGTLTKMGGGVIRLDGTNSFGALEIRGGVLAFTNQASVPAGFTLSNASTIQVAGTGGSFANPAGGLTNTIAPTINGAYALRFDDTLGASTVTGGRWGDTAALSLVGSQISQSDTLNMLGNSTVDYTETVGAISYRGGVRLRLNAGFINRNITLSGASIARVGTGTLELAVGVSTLGLGVNGTQASTLHGTGGGAAAGARLLLTTAPARGNNGTGTVNMVTPTIWNASTQNFVDYAPADVLGFNDIAYTSTNLNAPGGVVTVLAAATALTASPTVYALKITGALTAAAAQTVTILGDQTGGNDGTASLIPSGAITANDANTTLFFGTSGASPVPREAIIHAQGGNVTFLGKLVANGLTKDGDSAIVMSADETRSGSGATLTGLEGVITVNRGILSLRVQNSVGKGGTGGAGTGTTRIVLAGGTLETRLDTATTFGAGSSGAAYDIEIAANSTINPDRIGTTNTIRHTFGNLTFSNGADTLNVIGGSGHSIQFTGTTAINLAANTTFNVNDTNSNGAGFGGAAAASSELITRGALTDGASTFGIIKTGSGKWTASNSAGTGSMTFDGGTRVDEGQMNFEYSPATAAAATLNFGTGAITLNNGGGFTLTGAAVAAGATPTIDLANAVNVVDFGGGLHLIASNNFQNLRYTGQINLAAPLLIGNGNSGVNTTTANLVYGVAGSTVVSINQATAGPRVIQLGTVSAATTKDTDITGNIVDGAGAAGNMLVLQNQSGVILNINGTANTYAGGTRILSPQNNGTTLGRIDVAAASSLGAGNVIMDGGFLTLGALTNVAATKTVRLNNAYGNAATLVFRGLDPTQAQLAAVIDPASSNSIVGLSLATTTQALNMGALGDGTLFLGAGVTATTYSPTTLGVGAGGTYRLGGGNATLTLTNTAGNILTGANALQVGNASAFGGFGQAGNVTLNNFNDFTGGTVVDMGSSTFTVAGINGLSTGSLTTWTGTTTINAAQSFTTNAINGGTVNSSNVRGMGGNTNTINVGLGSGTAVGPTFATNAADQNYAALNFTGNAFVRPNSSVVVSSLSYNANALVNTYTIGSNGGTTAGGVLVVSGGAPATGNSTLVNVVIQGAAQTNGTLGGGAFSISNIGQLPGGNLNLNLGALVLNNISWATFAGNRTGGVAASGAGTWQLTGAVPVSGITPVIGNSGGLGGFAARGTAITIDSTGTTTSTFDRDFALGSAATVANQIWANAPVTLSQSIVLTARRMISIAPTGPGLLFANGTTNRVAHVISGNLSGAGVPVFRSTIGSAALTGNNDGTVGEIVLSGTNTWTGSANFDTDGGGNTTLFSTGPGGMLIINDNNPGTNGDVFVRFASPSALPTGNAGAPSFLAGIRYTATGARSGYLFTGGTGTPYQLGTGYKIILGSYGGTINQSSQSLVGSSGGDATFRGSAVVSMSGNTANATTIANGFSVFARDSVFTLGGSGANALSFQPGSVNGTSAVVADPGLAAAATAVVDSTGARTVFTRGAGLISLGGVSYDLVNGTGDTSALYTWQLGIGATYGGASNASVNVVAEGFVRENSNTMWTGDVVADNFSNVRTVMNGGTLEFASTPRAITLGTAVGNVNMANAGGGGFAASGAARSVGLNANAALTWASTAQFLGTNQTLLLGSPTANNTLTMTNAINFNGATRSVATLGGTAGATPVGEISGILSNSTGTAGLTVTRAFKPDATAWPTGTLTLSGVNTYNGDTTANFGTVRVGNAAAIPSGASRGNLIVNNAAAIDLGGTSITVNGLATSVGTSGTVTNSGGAAATFTVGANNTTSQYDGRIVDGVNAVALTKTGTGTLTITNASNYSGATTISDGILRLGVPTAASAARQWTADSLALSNGAAVSSWTDTVAGKIASNSGSGTLFNTPTYATAAIGTHAAVRFNGMDQALQVAAADSPIGGQTAFTIAVVFKANGNGLAGASQWYNNVGIIDAEEAGTTNDWGLGYNSFGQVGAGIGNSDNTNYSVGGLTGSTHVALFTWNGATGTITNNVDGISTVTTGAGAGARNAARFLFGSMNSGTSNYFMGDIADIGMYSGVLSNTQLNLLGNTLASTYGVGGTAFTSVATSNLLPIATAVSLSNIATLDLNSINQQIGSLTGFVGSSVTLGSAALTVGNATSTAYSGTVSGAGGKLTKIGAGTLTLDGTGANTYTGLTTVTNGILALNKTPGLDAVSGNGLTDKTPDILINGGTLRWDASNQVGNLVTVNMTSGALDLNGKADTIYDFTNAGGTFTTGVGGSLTAPDPTFSGGTSTFNADSVSTFGVLNISGGVNTLQGRSGPAAGATAGAVLNVGALGGLNFSGTASPSLILNSDAASGGKVVLQGNVTSTVTAGLASITSTGAGGSKGTLDLNGANRTVSVDNGAAGVDMLISANITGATGAALTKTGLGTLNLDGAQNYLALTTSAGITNVNGSFTGGTATVNANATTNFYASQTLAALNIAAGVEVTFGDGLSFTGGSGKSGAAFGGSAVVPEPGSVALLLVGTLGLLGRRRRLPL